LWRLGVTNATRRKVIEIWVENGRRAVSVVTHN
jgi:hypothetical protein